MLPTICDASENVVRAILEAHWDEVHRRAASQLFKGRNQSVSRLAVHSLPKTWGVLGDIFKDKLVKLGEINVGKLVEIGQSHQEPIQITVEITPSPRNAAHAEIPQNITRTLSQKFVNNLVLHDNSEQKNAIESTPEG